MTVKAICLDCEDVHSLGDRTGRSIGSTACPRCSSPSYESAQNGTDVDGDEVRELVAEVDGVGETSVERIGRTFDWPRVPYEFAETSQTASAPDADSENLRKSVERLTDVPHVGPQTAQNIVEATDKLLTDA